MANLTHWRLKPRTLRNSKGEIVGTDDAEKLRNDGLAYIERLKKDFPDLTVEERDDKFIIDLNDGN